MHNQIPLKPSYSVIRAKVLTPTFYDPEIWFLCFLQPLSILRAKIILFIPEFTEPSTMSVLEQVLSENTLMHSTNICCTQMRAISVFSAGSKTE